MWSLIPQKMIPPTRLARYCCEILKEGGGEGRFITTGVRWSESRKRKEGRGIYESFAKNKAQKIILIMIMTTGGSCLNPAGYEASLSAIRLWTGVTMMYGTIYGLRR